MDNCKDMQEEVQNAEVESTVKNEAEEVKSEAEVAEEAPVQKEQKSGKKQVKKLEQELLEANKALDAANASLTEQKEQYLRVLAEYDNYRKRTQKEKDSIYADAYSDAVKQILPVIDNLELAAKQSADADAAAILGGVEMILKTAVENLGKLNIKSFGEVGDAFDPNCHTAVFHVEDESLGENVIAEVLQKGYERDGRIIRYAVVKVAN